MTDNDDPNDAYDLAVLAETEHYAVLAGEDMDGEMVYNVELGTVTLHLFQEEWDELVDLIREAARHE